MNLRRKNDIPAEPTPAPDQGATMTMTPTISLESDEPAEMLIHGLRDADRIARDAQEKATAALVDADRIAQGIGELNRREDEIRAELAKISESRDNLAKQEADARTYAANHHALRDKKAAAVNSYKRLLAMASVPIDEHLLVPTAPLADPSAETRMDRSIENFNAAHDELDSAGPGVDL